MKHLFRLTDIASLALLAVGCAALFAAQAPMADGATNGQQLFTANCAACHTGGGNSINPKKPVKCSPKLASKDSFKAFLLKPTGVMPPFPQIANDSASLEALYKYCKSL